MQNNKSLIKSQSGIGRGKNVFSQFWSGVLVKYSATPSYSLQNRLPCHETAIAPGALLPGSPTDENLIEIIWKMNTIHYQIMKTFLRGNVWKDCTVVGLDLEDSRL